MDGSGLPSSKKHGLELELEDLPDSTKKQKVRVLEPELVRREGTSSTSNLEFPKKNQSTQILQPCASQLTSNPPTDPCLLTLGQPCNNSKLPDLNANTDEHMDQSECGSTTGPIEEEEENGPLKRWKEMKQNGFLSSSHKELIAPKPRARKSRKKSEEEIQKQKRAYVQKEQALQASRFSRVTGPSGLLTGLNPGIINHVRNSKQVYSIIEAIVKDSSLDNKETGNNCTGFEDCNGFKLGAYQPDMNFGTGTGTGNELSGVTGLSEDFGSNQEAVTSLSLKAASAGSQWMELLQQDIKGRLAALRRSKKRVRNVINTELPYIISTEISYNDPNLSDNGSHVEKWKFMFAHMDKALHEEARYLENWLRQIQEMQSKCEKGLKYVVGMEGLLLGPINTEFSKGKKMEAMEHEQVVKAAAASMYSTCNLVMKKENVSSF